MSILNNIVAIVKEAAKIMTTDHFDVMQKDGFVNVVTSSDLAVQHFLTEKLSELLPGSGFLCEEEDFRKKNSGYVWIIDPIDGTTNYSRGITDCCISVALANGNEVVAGVVYSPGREELYTAEKGLGAFCNGKPIHVSSRLFDDSIICTALCTYYKEYSKICNDIIMDMYYMCNDFRRLGTAALELCLLAAGKVELYFEMRLQPWDYAAASLILMEAGGLIAGYDGTLPSLEKPSLVIAANSADNLSEINAAIHRHIPVMPY